jgi:hypothetical protein
MNPKKLIIIGFFMVLFGFAVPFLMVMKLLESTFLLNFLSYTASVGGLFMGIIGAAWYARIQRS